MKAARTCSIEGCGSPHHCRGLCDYHYHREWNLKNKEKRNAISKKWSIKNKEKVKSASMQYRNKNKEKIISYNKEWYIKNKENTFYIRKERGRIYIEKLGDGYLRGLFKLPPDTPSNVIDSCRSLMLNVRRMRNERP